MYFLSETAISRILRDVEADLRTRRFPVVKTITKPKILSVNKSWEVIPDDFLSSNKFKPCEWNLYPDVLPPKRGEYIVDVVIVLIRDDGSEEDFSEWKAVCEWTGKVLHPIGQSHDVRSDRKFKSILEQAKSNDDNRDYVEPGTETRVEVRFRSFYE